MSWLDAPCTPEQISEWGCTDDFVEYPKWPWICKNADPDPPQCGASYYLSDLKVTPTPDQSVDSGTSNQGLSILFGLFLVIMGGVCAALATNRLGNAFFEFQSVSVAPEKPDDLGEV